MSFTNTQKIAAAQVAATLMAARPHGPAASNVEATRIEYQMSLQALRIVNRINQVADILDDNPELLDMEGRESMVRVTEIYQAIDSATAVVDEPDEGEDEDEDDDGSKGSGGDSGGGTGFEAK